MTCNKQKFCYLFIKFNVPHGPLEALILYIKIEIFTKYSTVSLKSVRLSEYVAENDELWPQ